MSSYITRTIEADDGTPVTITFPSTTQSRDRAEYLRKLWKEHVRFDSDHWKGPVVATVDERLADDVAEAMDFMGAIIDRRFESDGRVLLYSDGYWAHGF